MIRIVIYVAGLSLAVAIAVWIADRPGSVSIDWLGYRLESDVGVLLLLMLAVAIVMTMAMRFYSALLGLPEDIRLWRRAGRLRKGYDALTQGMVAIAAGDAADARLQAEKSRALLNDHPLSMIVAAEAAQLSGDRDAAAHQYRQMRHAPGVEFVAVRGQLINAMRESKQGESLKLAVRAHRLKPRVPWVVRTLFDLQVRQARWTDALATLKDAKRHRIVGEHEFNRKKAYLLLLKARAARDEGGVEEALRGLKAAHALAPDNEAIAIEEAALLVEGDRARVAMKAIETAWARTPSRALAEAYRAAVEHDRPGLGRKEASGLERVRRLEKLLAINPGTTDGHAIVGAAALDAQEWALARTHLEAAVAASEGRPDAWICKQMARLEEAAPGDAEKARAWLLRASEAPSVAWTCQACAAAHPRWDPVCGACGAFDAIERAVAVAMLPPAREESAARTAPESAQPTAT